VCRHIAWLGPPRRLSELSLEPEHGLIVQSYAPRRQAHGRMNAGGWGAGFFTAGRPEPTGGRSGLAGELDPET
jgi:gamma-glutamyl hercynylcysteine S-oxide hydrolase